jgi:allantoicase
MSLFNDLVDLATARNGGFVEEASDDFFAPKERLILPDEAVYRAGRYTDRGKWMDGWESRRKRTPGHDWCIVRLGLPGLIRGVDIDTSHFVGNHPPEASIDAAERDGPEVHAVEWMPLLSRVALQPDAHNLFEVDGETRATHVRLNIFPDGGVARLRIYGDVVPNWSSFQPGDLIELSAVENGGRPVFYSDQHFGSAMNLLRADPPVNMSDGWETRRRRDRGHDWVVISLGATGVLDRLEIDTSHFKGNYPDRCSVDACLLPEGTEISVARWESVLTEQKLEADRVHQFGNLVNTGPFSHVRLNIYPDGGVARLRAFGRRYP